jgi:hypothetical protein
VAGAVTLIFFSLVLKKILGAAPHPFITLLFEALLFLAIYGGLLRIAGLQPEDKVVLNRIKEKFSGWK